MRRLLPTILFAAMAVFVLARPVRADVTITYPYRGVTEIYCTETSPRPENIHIMEINLADPGISFEVSPANPPSPNTYTNETLVQTTLSYLNQVHAAGSHQCLVLRQPAGSQQRHQFDGFRRVVGQCLLGL